MFFGMVFREELGAFEAVIHRVKAAVVIAIYSVSRYPPFAALAAGVAMTFIILGPVAHRLHKSLDTPFLPDSGIQDALLAKCFFCDYITSDFPSISELFFRDGKKKKPP